MFCVHKNVSEGWVWRRLWLPWRGVEIFDQMMDFSGSLSFAVCHFWPRSFLALMLFLKLWWIKSCRQLLLYESHLERWWRGSSQEAGDAQIISQKKAGEEIIKPKLIIQKFIYKDLSQSCRENYCLPILAGGSRWLIYKASNVIFFVSHFQLVFVKTIELSTDNFLQLCQVSLLQHVWVANAARGHHWNIIIHMSWFCKIMMVIDPTSAPDVPFWVGPFLICAPCPGL